jgi:DNA mismatch repair ATPase MutS
VPLAVLMIYTLLCIHIHHTTHTHIHTHTTQLAAMKRASSNAKTRAGPFERKLTEVYTRGTFLPVESGGGEDAVESNDRSLPKYIVALVERDCDSNRTPTSASFSSSSPSSSSSSFFPSAARGPPDSVEYAVMAIETLSGAVVLDIGADGVTRSNIDTLLTRLQPVEIILSSRADFAVSERTKGNFLTLCVVGVRPRSV